MVAGNEISLRKLELSWRHLSIPRLLVQAPISKWQPCQLVSTQAISILDIYKCDSPQSLLHALFSSPAFRCLLAKIKCSICSCQLNRWYRSHRDALRVIPFLRLDSSPLYHVHGENRCFAGLTLLPSEADTFPFHRYSCFEQDSEEGAVGFMEL